MKYIYNGRYNGKNLLFHEWFRELIPTLKTGWTMGIPTKNGIAVFKFMGIQKQKSSFNVGGIDTPVSINTTLGK